MSFTIVRRSHAGFAFLLFAAIVLSSATQAQGSPNFSGEWKMNVAKSEFAPMPAPNSRTDKIDHKDPKIKVTTTQSGQNGEATIDINYATDGTETTNELRGAPMKSTGKWEGDALVIVSKVNFQGNDVLLTDKWTLAEDGKSITIARHIKAPQGEFDQKMLLEKQ